MSHFLCVVCMHIKCVNNTHAWYHYIVISNVGIVYIGRTDILTAVVMLRYDCAAVAHFFIWICNGVYACLNANCSIGYLSRHTYSESKHFNTCIYSKIIFEWGLLSDVNLLTMWQCVLYCNPRGSVHLQRILMCKYIYIWRTITRL